MVEAFSGLELLLLLQFILCRSSNRFSTNPTFGNVSDGELVSTGCRVVREALSYDLILIVVMMADNAGYWREAWL